MEDDDFKQAILQRAREQMSEVELSLPDPNKSSVEQFNQHQNIEEIFVRMNHIPEAVANCKRKTEVLQKEREFVAKRIQDIEEDKKECLKKEDKSAAEREINKIKLRKYEQQENNIEVEKIDIAKNQDNINVQKDLNHAQINQLQKEFLEAMNKKQELYKEEEAAEREAEENKNQLEQNMQELVAQQAAIELLEKRLTDQAFSGEELQEEKNQIELQLRDLRDTLQGLEPVIAQTKEDIRAIQNLLQNLSGDIDTLSQAILDLEIEKETQENTVVTLEEMKKMHVKEIDKMEKEKSTLETEILNEENALDNIRDTTVTTKGSCGGENKENISREPERATKRAKIQRLRDRYNQLVHRINSYQDRVLEKTMEISKAKDKAHAAGRKAEAAKTKRTDKKEEKTRQEQTLSATQQVLQGKQEEKIQAARSFRANEEKLKVLSLDLQNAKSALQKMNHEKSGIEEKIGVLERNKGDLQAQKEKLADDLSQNNVNQQIIKQKLDGINSTQRAKDQELNKLDQKAQFLKMKQVDNANAQNFHSGLITDAYLEGAAINKTFKNLDQNQKGYGILLKQYDKGMEMRLGNTKTIQNVNYSS